MSQFYRGAIGGGPIGNVFGPASSTDNAITRFDGTTGKIIQNSSITIDDDGNLDVGASFSGSTKFLLLQNNVNTASSATKMSQLVGGTSAGDVYDEFRVGTARSYSWGIDNDDSQTFKLTTDASGNVDPSSGTSVLEITSGGQVSLPSATLTEHGVMVVGASGLLTSTAVGASTQILTSNGAGLAPTFQAASGVTSVSGTTNRVSSTGGNTPVIDIDAAYVGQGSITTLGTIATGVWNGTVVAATSGGTAQSTYATGDILYASATDTLSKLAAGANGLFLTLTAGVPAWTANASGDVTAAATITDNAVVRGDGGAKGVQESAVVIDDAAAVTGVRALSVILDAGTTFSIDGSTNPGTSNFGVFNMSHTSGVDNTRAIDSLINPAGNGSVSGHFMRFIATDLIATDVSAGVVVQVDRDTSTGGNISAFRATSCGLGTSNTTGLLCTSGVDPVRSRPSAEVDAGTVFTFNAATTSFTDITTAAGTVGSDVTIFGGDEDYLYFGHATEFNEISFVLTTVAAGSGIRPVFEFSAGGASWNVFSPLDGTNGMRYNGSVTWDSDISVGWTTDTVNGVAGLFWIRIRRTKNSLSIVPVEDLIQIAPATEYFWDKEGNLSINSLTVANDLSVEHGGTGVSSITDGGVLVGSGTSSLTALTVGTDGQVLIGSTSADPVFGNITQGAGIVITEGPGTLTIASGSKVVDGVTNLGIAYNAGTGVFTVQGSTAALSSSNAASITLQSKATPGSLTTIQVTANQSFIDDAGASEIINNLFGLTTGVGITNDIPFFIYAVTSNDEASIAFMISRVPSMTVSPAVADIGAPDDAVADNQFSFFSFDNIDETLFDANPCLMIGSFRMVMSASDDWTVQALSITDGIGKFQINQVFTNPLGQFGANAATYTIPNGGTAATFGLLNSEYTIDAISNTCSVTTILRNDGGIAGVGAVSARITSPYKALSMTGENVYPTHGNCYISSPGTGNLSTSCAVRGNSIQFWFAGGNRLVQWGDFTIAGRNIEASAIFQIATI